MTKILNLDEIPNEIDQTVIYKGESHAFRPLSVDEFIKTVRLSEEVQNDDGDTDSESFSRRIATLRDSIGNSFPTLAPHIPTMPFNSLMAIFEFLAKTADGDAAKVAAEFEKEAEGNVQAELDLNQS